MNCQSCRIEIEELELGEALSEHARAHMKTCSPCGAFYNERLSLRKLVGSLEPVSAPPDFEFRLRARLAANGSARNHRFSLRSFIASAPAISLAASFAVLVAAFVVYNHFKSATAPTQQPEIIAAQNPERVSEEAKGTAVSENGTSEIQQGATESVKKSKASSSAVQGSVNNSSQRMAVNKNASRQQRPQPNVNNQQIIINDTASRAARQITPANDSSFMSASNPLVELPVRSSSQPVRVMVDDRTGVKRSVTLEPVIFGSQDVTGRSSSFVQTSHGIW